MLTFTGVDRWTEIDHILSFLESCSRPWREAIEFGLLFNGRDAEGPKCKARYLTIHELPLYAEFIPNTALHVCGSEGKAQFLQPSWHMGRAIQFCQRIQLNGSWTDEEVLTLCEKYSRHGIITQLNHSFGQRQRLARNHHILFDCSGGKGLVPSSWKLPEGSEPVVSMAGGLGPDNIQEATQAYTKANPISPMGWDMESSLRTNDRFDLKIVEKVYKIVSQR